jgi:hypothetical protein
LFSKRYKNLNKLLLFSFLIFSIAGIIGGSFSIFNASAQSTFPNFNFAAVGDWDCGSNAVATRNSIINTNPDLVVGLGDYSYEANADCWLNIVDPFDHKMKIAIGNHEIEESSQSLGQYLTHFNMSRQYHSFNFQNIHFLILATDDSFGTTSSQYSFAVNDLKAASSNSNIDWIVVAFHKPLYDVPCSSDSCGDEDAFRNIYHPLFDQYDVDLALYGHAHNYVRTFPIKHDSATSDSPIITSTNRNNYVNPDGEVFVQSGAGGRSLRDLTGTESYNAFQSDSEFGILNIDVVNTNSDNLQLLGKFIQNDGDVIDQFTITKQDTTTPPPAEICNNGADDDGDGKIDSADPDCQTPTTGYHYEPFFTATGSNKLDVPNNSTLRLSSFTAATWFKTTATFRDEGVMVNKGGLGSESAGANQNYGLWFTSPPNRLQGGFETTGGTNRYITLANNTLANNFLDGQWHHSVVTFDNPNNIVRLFVDGIQIDTLSTTSNPDNTGSQPLRIAGNAQSLTQDFFVGQLDEIGVWNRALTSAEITNLMNTGLFPSNGLVYRNSFGTSTLEVCNDNIDNDGDTLIDAADPDCKICTNLPISTVKANGFQSGNPPQNAIDNNLNTRWSQEGIGSWIQLDLGIQKLICSVDIAWYLGNQRQNNFVISVSSDGTTFNNIFTGTSSGNTLSPENYDFSDVNARYVKITVNGNTQNQWASITENDVYGPDPSPPPEICGDGIDNDGDILIDEGCPQPPPPLNFKFAYKFGTKGNGNGQFQDPHDVSFDSSGNVFVPDRVRSDIQKFTHEGVFLSKFGGPGSGPGQFNVPYSIAHDSNNNIYVSDRENNRIQKLTKDGVFITELKRINGKNFVMPEDLAFDFTNDDLYITDTGNNRIVKLDKNLNFILQWGSKGTGDGQFDHPHAIDVGPDRNVYVSSGFQPYIQKFDPNGKFIKKWGKEGSGDGEMLMFLEHLDVDSEGRVFLINNNIRPVVQVWDSEGNYLTKFGSEKEGSVDGQLAEPEHVTVDNDGKPFIVDSGNFRIQVFTPEIVSTAELDPIKKTQPSSDMIPKDLLSRLPSMVSPFNLQ